MKKFLLVSAVGALSIVLGLGAGLASAGKIAPDWSIDPTHGLPGTEITVTGVGCLPDGNGYVHLTLWAADGTTVLDQVPTFRSEKDGSFSATLNVPTEGVEAGDELSATAVCDFNSEETTVLGGGPTYQTLTFTVDAEPEPEPEPEEPTVQPAPPAEPEVEAAAFTG